MKSTESWNPIDVKFYGRCYTFVPSVKMIENGIFWLDMLFRTKVRVFVHNHGVLRTSKTGRSQNYDVTVNIRHRVNVEHDLYEMLDFEGTPCIRNKSYSLDECILNKLEMESMKKVGCVTPFGNTSRKEKICEDPAKGKRP